MTAASDPDRILSLDIQRCFAQGMLGSIICAIIRLKKAILLNAN